MASKSKNIPQRPEPERTATTGGLNILLTRQQAADVLQVPIELLCNWASRRIGPKFIKVGRLVRYRASDLEIWLEQQTVKTGATLI